MVEWFRNIEWNKEIEDAFDLKLKRARGDYSKAQYLRIQASYLLDSEIYGEVGVVLMKRLINDYPNELFSVIFGHEQLGDFYFKAKQFDLSEQEYTHVVKYYHNNTRSGTSGMADIKLADLILTTQQIEKYDFAYKLITRDFINSKGELGLNDDRYYYALIRALLSYRLKMIKDAKEYATLALDLSNITEPQFPRHKNVGIVKAKEQERNELLEIIKK